MTAFRHAAPLALAPFVLMSLLVACAPGGAPDQVRARAPAAGGIWLSAEEIRALPAEGPAWEALEGFARAPLPGPDLSDKDDPSNVRVLARALYAVRTQDARAEAEVLAALERVQGTEAEADALSLGRELMSYVVAADLIGLPPASRRRFEDWLRDLRRREFGGRTLRSAHERRPNNWGTHAGATRIAIAAYLDDRREIERAAHVFRGWLGEPDGWRGFVFREPWWLPDGADRASGINPAGAMRAGHPVDGVLPDDQRRGGPFRWPPPRENYVYEALQGAVAQALLLERQGYRPWEWGDRALLRAFRWLHEQARFPATGDDTWLPHVINARYCTSFPAPMPSRPGKAAGFTDWTHRQAGDCGAVPARSQRGTSVAQGLEYQPVAAGSRVPGVAER